MVGRGTGIDDAGWIRKTAAVRDALAAAGRTSATRRDCCASSAAPTSPRWPASWRRPPSGAPLSCSTGSSSGAAALVAERLRPGAAAWWLAGHRSPEPAHTAALAALGLEPLLDLGLRLGEGTGALLAVPLLQCAAASLAMATFDEAGVSDRSPPADRAAWQGFGSR